MRILEIALLCCTVLTLQTSTPPRPAPSAPKSAPKMRLWVPAYFYPNGPGLSEWNRLIAAAKSVPIVVIVNLNSGPGDHVDPYFAAVLPRARKAGIKLVGYIGTQYARKPLAKVEEEVETYLKFYPDLQGIHFDEQSSDSKSVDYYAELYNYVRRRIPGGLVLTNPGTECSAEYVSRPASDVVCLFERNSGFDGYQPPEWVSRFPASRFCIQAYQVDTEAQMQRYLQAAAKERFGYVYITDGRGANPYDHLPLYWDAEVAAVHKMNAASER